jgi:type IV pilus assembly protein PilM
MFGSTKAVIGLDVGSYAVKAVALQSNRDRITLQAYAQARIDNQDLSEVIKRVIGQLGLKSKRVVTAVSGRSVIVRQVDTPKLQDAELKQHITYEADKYIPFGTEEVIIDCQPMPIKPGSNEDLQQVMLVAVRKGFVQEHLSSLRAAGLVPEVIDVDVFALANAYELLGPPMPPESERKATAIIDIGATKTNIAIMLADRLLFTREIYLAGNEISDSIARTLNYQPDEVDAMKLAPGEALESIVDAAMPAFEDLANEIRLSFDYVEGQFDTEVANVVLSGGTSQLPNFGNILGNIISRPVFVFDPLAGLDLVPSRYDIHGLDANSPGLTVALGLAAHILEHPQRSLGGQQSHSWQPRSRAVELGHMSAATQDGLPNEGQPAEDNPAARTGETMVPKGIYAAEGTQSQEERPEPETYVQAPPALAAPVSIKLPESDLDHLPLRPAGRDDSEQNRSGLLVVLEDDEEQPEPETYVQGPPALAVPASIGLPDDDLDPLLLRSTGRDNSEQDRSGLLVVLDDHDHDHDHDDDDDVPSDHIDKQTAAIKRGPGSHMPSAAFDDSTTEEVKKPGQVDLPDLPELPGR